MSKIITPEISIYLAPGILGKYENGVPTGNINAVLPLGIEKGSLPIPAQDSYLGYLLYRDTEHGFDPNFPANQIVDLMVSSQN